MAVSTAGHIVSIGLSSFDVDHLQRKSPYPGSAICLCEAVCIQRRPWFLAYQSYLERRSRIVFELTILYVCTVWLIIPIVFCRALKPFAHVLAIWNVQPGCASSGRCHYMDTVFSGTYFVEMRGL